MGRTVFMLVNLSWLDDGTALDVFVDIFSLPEAGTGYVVEQGYSAWVSIEMQGMKKWIDIVGNMRKNTRCGSR